MVETAVYSKNRICIEDYDYKRDIQNRILMANLLESDLELLEEIICSPTRVAVTRLSEQLGWSLSDTVVALDKLSRAGLFTKQGTTLIVDKEIRKYFETELAKFEENFVPGWDFLHSMLKKVPMDALLTWYPIPRTANNIFQSIVDKYLKKPQLFERYLREIDFEDPILNGIKEDLIQAPECKIYGKEIKEKYALTDEAFEKAILHLEFNFICCLSYEKKGTGWVEIVTFFQEWKDYLGFVRENSPKTIEHKLTPLREGEFPFARDISLLIQLAQKEPIYVELDHKERWIFDRKSLPMIEKTCPGFCLTTEEGQETFFDYFSRMIQKLLLVKFAKVAYRQLKIGVDVDEWLELPLDKRALHLYKLTLKNYSFADFPPEICSDRMIHGIEKSIRRIQGHGWVFFDDFMQGLAIPLHENSQMNLEQTGRRWRYRRPEYTAVERLLIKKIIYEWLFEAGVVATASFDGRPCLAITPFGKALFAQ